MKRTFNPKVAGSIPARPIREKARKGKDLWWSSPLLMTRAGTNNPVSIRGFVIPRTERPGKIKRTPSRWRFRPPSPQAFRLTRRLPRTTRRSGFDLIALRTRCSTNVWQPEPSHKGSRNENSAKSVRPRVAARSRRRRRQMGSIAERLRRSRPRLAQQAERDQHVAGQRSYAVTPS